MLMPGEVVELDFGSPMGSEAGLRRPAVVVTAEQILRGQPNVIQVVPLTSTVRASGAEITVSPDSLNGLDVVSVAQCQHIRSVATSRVVSQLGNVGVVVLRQVRAVVATIIDA